MVELLLAEEFDQLFEDFGILLALGKFDKIDRVENIPEFRVPLELSP